MHDHSPSAVPRRQLPHHRVEHGPRPGPGVAHGGRASRAAARRRRRDQAEPGSGRRGGGENLPADRDQVQGQERLGDETYRGIEPSLVWAIEQQLYILDNVTRLSPEPRVAAVRCALALRQALVEIGTIVSDLRPPPILAYPAGGGPEPQLRRGRGFHAAVAAELTEREREVIRLVAQGHLNRMICGELFLAEVTVKKHVQSIMRKFGVTSRTQAAIVAVKLGLDR